MSVPGPGATSRTPPGGVLGGRSGAAGAILFALLALVLFVAAAFATGFLIGKLLI